MNESSPEIKNMYIIAIIVMLFFVAFIIFVVVLYNRKQLLYIKEKQLAEAEHQNQILQKELEKQKMVEEERERISHDMHDDLGAGISALKLQAEFLKMKINDSKLTEDINDMMKTSEEMNVSMREMLWSLNSENDKLFNFINYAINYSENFLKKTETQITIKKNLQKDESLRAETRRNLFLCLKESLNNIYKHSNSDQVELHFLQDDNQFLFIISDNGIGLENKSAKGNGLKNMEKRMKHIQGNFQVLEREKGTALQFSIPI